MSFSSLQVLKDLKDIGIRKILKALTFLKNKQWGGE